MSIVVTGATGHLGRHVVEGLLERVPADRITAVVRDPASLDPTTNYFNNVMKTARRPC